MRSFKVTLGVLFILLTIIVLGLAIISYFSYQKFNSTSQSVKHSGEVLEQVENLSSEFKVMLLESNAMLLIRDTTALSRYILSRSRVLGEVDSLRSLTAGNSLQAETLNTINALVKELITGADSAFVHVKPLTESELKVRLAKNIDIRNQLQNAIAHFRSAENELLLEGQQLREESVVMFDAIVLTLLILALLILAATFLTIRQSFNKRAKVERELMKANDLFHMLFYQSPVALSISQPEEGMIIDCNTVYARLVNYKREDIIGQTVRTLGILAGDLSQEQFFNGVKQEKTTHGLEVIIQPRHKEPLWVNISHQPIQLKDRECLLSAMIDISSHKLAEKTTNQALEKEKELNRLKSNFITLASHEFRTPLTTVLSSAFLLENYLPQDGREKTLKHLTRIKSSVNALTTILDEFLSLTKIEEGKMFPRQEEVDLKALISAICKTQRDFARPGQSIQCSHQGKEIVVSDAAILTGIVTNLVSNSIKYSSENSLIKVSSEVGPEYFTLTVEDSGIGIPLKDKPHLFERFYRASNAGTVQGTGLGLHISKHYVELLGGSITCTSEVGKGTTFKVSFGNV